MDGAHAVAPLLGAWVTDPTDEDGLRDYGQATLEFAPGGQLTFTAHGGERDQILLMDYQVEGDVLVMQSGASIAPTSRATFRLTRGGVLELRYGDRRARYIRRADPHAPPAPSTAGGAAPIAPVAPPAAPRGRPWWRVW